VDASHVGENARRGCVIIGCNCGGSTRPSAENAVHQQATVARDVVRDMTKVVPGGPGEPGYVWNGPEAVPEPAAAE
jgi:hypothetical protein